MSRRNFILFDQLKFKSTINDYCGEYEVFSPDYPVKFNYCGESYNSIADAKSKLITDDMPLSDKLTLLGKVLYYRFAALPQDKAVLVSTKDIWLCQNVDNCDNFWHNCSCKNCFFESGENYYGRLLMEVRDYFIWEDTKDPFGAHTKRKWEKKYL